MPKDTPKEGDLFLITEGVKCAGMVAEFQDTFGGSFWLMKPLISETYAARHNLQPLGIPIWNMIAVEEMPAHEFDLDQIVTIENGTKLDGCSGIIRAIRFNHERTPWHVSYSVDISAGADDVAFMGSELRSQ